MAKKKRTRVDVPMDVVERWHQVIREGDMDVPTARRWVYGAGYPVSISCVRRHVRAAREAGNRYRGSPTNGKKAPAAKPLVRTPREVLVDIEQSLQAVTTRLESIEKFLQEWL